MQRLLRINSDVDDHGIKPDHGEYRMAENLVPPQKGVGQGHIRESLKGTIESVITDPEYPIGPKKVIGSYEDKPNEKIYFFLYTGDFDRIMVYDSKTKLTSRIIRTTQFNWTEDTKIVGIGVLDNVIYWADPNLCYYRIKDQSQLAEIDYNCREITSAIVVTFYFVAENDTYFFTAKTSGG